MIPKECCLQSGCLVFKPGQCKCIKAENRKTTGALLPINKEKKDK